MKKLRLVFTCLVSFFSFALTLAGSAQAGELHLFAGAGLRQPVDRLVGSFQAETGHKVLVDFGGGGQLLTRIKGSGKGDLFMPGAFFYIEKLDKEGRVLSWREVVAHTPVIGVNRKAADRIKSFDDLAKPGVRLAMGDPKAMAFGRTAMEVLEKSGKKDAIIKNVTVYGATVKQLALYVSQGSVDASIIGRSDAFQNKERIAIVPIPEALSQEERIAIAVLNSTAQQDLAVRLRDFMSSERAVKVFEEFGFLRPGKESR
ncbi:MAG: molybdate ABC transporter substrate-binding protein [Deltaproteobacteria bacterium]|nr:molybdate ABC transporter substrate-binding protein [Deltaproteobacteria bacterium]